MDKVKKQGIVETAQVAEAAASKLWQSTYGDHAPQEKLPSERDKETIVAACSIPGYPGSQDRQNEALNKAFWHSNFIHIKSPVAPVQIVDALIAQVKEHGKLLGDVMISCHGLAQGKFMLGGYKYSFGDPIVLSEFSRLKKYIAPGSRITFTSCSAGYGELAPIGLQKLADVSGAKLKAFEWDQTSGFKDGFGPFVEKAPSKPGLEMHSSLDYKTIDRLTSLAELQDANGLAQCFGRIPQAEHKEAVLLMSNHHDNRVRQGIAKDDLFIGAENTKSGTQLFVDSVKKHPSLFGVTNVFFPDRSKIFRETIKGQSIAFHNDFDNQWGVPRDPGLCEEWH